MLLVLALRFPATRCDPRRHQRRLHGGETQAAHGMGCTSYQCNGLAFTRRMLRPLTPS
jgi:hypothetical protein